ncbi:helix-turn-helix transcriptional regulator [Mucilaginibacter gracilis]|nr:helix-turn-helix transcriptional regulator [Mucilaginibacter gracilis]
MEKMQRPILLKFKSEHKIISKISQDFLKKVRYRVGHGEKELIEIKEGTIYSQRHNHYLFFIEIIELRLTEELDMSYLVHNPALFLFFMLHGNVSFSLTDGNAVAEADKGVCYPTYNKPGEFFANFPKGLHYLFYISTRPGWLKNHLDDYPYFREFMNGFEHNTDLYSHLPQYPIIEPMRKFLRELYKINPASPRSLEIGITNNCMGLFEEYHRMLESGKNLKSESPREIIISIREHIDKHFTNEDIANLTLLAERFPLSDRSIRRLFSKEMQHSIRDYVEILRVNYGHELLRKTRLKVKEIAFKTGFKHPHYFTKVYKKHFDFTPKEARRRKF